MTVESVEDAEANHFAISILMPSGAMRRAVLEIGGVDLGAPEKDIRALAKKFQVDPFLLAIRVGQMLEARRYGK